MEKNPKNKKKGLTESKMLLRIQHRTKKILKKNHKKKKQNFFSKKNHNDRILLPE